MEMKQYIQLIQTDSNWLPGKEAISSLIKQQYATSPHFIALQELSAKSTAFNGIFVYKDGGECVRLTTCGLTQIPPNEYAFGQNRSGWGAELTATLHTTDKEKIKLCAKMLVQLTQYVNVRKTMFTEYSCINLSRLKCRDTLFQSSIAGLVFIHDAKLESIETIHGRVDFLQIIGVNSTDWAKIKKTPTLARQYIYEVKKSNPYFYVDQIGNGAVLL